MNIPDDVAAPHMNPESMPIQASAWLINEHRVSWDEKGLGSCRKCGPLSGALDSWEHQARILARQPDISRPQYLPGDLVKITLREGDLCNASHNGRGVVIYGPDDEGGWIVASMPSSLRCVASELTMTTPREARG